MIVELILLRFNEKMFIFGYWMGMMNKQLREVVNLSIDQKKYSYYYKYIE